MSKLTAIRKPGNDEIRSILKEALDLDLVSLTICGVMRDGTIYSNSCTTRSFIEHVGALETAKVDFLTKASD